MLRDDLEGGVRGGMGDSRGGRYTKLIQFVVHQKFPFVKSEKVMKLILSLIENIRKKFLQRFKSTTQEKAFSK